MGTFHMEMAKRWEGTENTLGYRIGIPKALHIFLKRPENSLLMGHNSTAEAWDREHTSFRKEAKGIVTDKTDKNSQPLQLRSHLFIQSQALHFKNSMTQLESVQKRTSSNDDRVETVTCNGKEEQTGNSHLKQQREMIIDIKEMSGY